jgi:hypothetical protein
MLGLYDRLPMAFVIHSFEPPRYFAKDEHRQAPGVFQGRCSLERMQKETLTSCESKSKIGRRVSLRGRTRVVG